MEDRQHNPARDTLLQPRTQGARSPIRRTQTAADRTGPQTTRTRTLETLAVGLDGIATPQEKHGATYTIGRRGRFWEVRDPIGTLVCMTVYKCGAQEVVRRLGL